MKEYEFDHCRYEANRSEGVSLSYDSNVRKRIKIENNKQICNFHGWKGGRNARKCPECFEIEKKLIEKINHTKFQGVSGMEYIDHSNTLDKIRVWLRCRMGHKLIYSLKDISHGCRVCSSEKFLSPKYRNNAIEFDLKKEEEYRKKQRELFAEAKQLFALKSCEDFKEQNIDSEVRKCIENYPDISYETAYAITYILKFKYEPYKLFQVPNSITPENKDHILGRLKSYFRSQARLVHPDKSNHPKSVDAFHILSNAYNEIKDYIDKYK